jgi:pyrroloquinoline quinone (PQQ) biosynthesis protein C
MQPFDRLKAETQESQSYLYGAPILEDVAAGRFDLGNYTGFLKNAYHHVRHTVPLMMACGSRLPDRLRWLQVSIKEYIVEEIGHEQWILEDLEACGVDSIEVVNSQPNFETELLVSYVYDYIDRINPVGFFGMVLVLEGTSTAIATETARLVQDKLGLPDNAFHYLRSHGEIDQEHVVFFENLINQLTDPQDLNAVIHVADRVFRLYGDVIRSASDGFMRHAA